MGKSSQLQGGSNYIRGVSSQGAKKSKDTKKNNPTQQRGRGF